MPVSVFIPIRVFIPVSVYKCVPFIPVSIFIPVGVFILVSVYKCVWIVLVRSCFVKSFFDSGQYRINVQFRVQNSITLKFNQTKMFSSSK